MNIFAEGGKLQMRYVVSGNIIFTPIYSDGFESAGKAITFVRDGSGSVIAFEFGDDRAWRVRFDKVTR